MDFYIDALTHTARNHQASDLFLAEGSVARLKVKGVFHHCGERLLSREDLVEFWQRCQANPDQDWDRDRAYISPEGVRFRVSLFRHMGRLGAVLRQIKTEVPKMDELGLPEALLTTWIQRPSGLILVTGPTGSGKSTTLAACIDWINHSRTCHIITIEDPIEYSFTPVRSFFTQREVGTDTESFASGLRSSLRQAPNVILLGEIRDAESAAIALQAAETGHLVLASMHSATATDTIARLVQLVPPNAKDSLLGLLSQQLIGVLNQQLLPNATGDGLTLICEHVEVVGAVRNWIREMNLPEIEEFMRRTDNSSNINYLTALITAFKAGKISYDTGVAHGGNVYEFNRILRGTL